VSAGYPIAQNLQFVLSDRLRDVGIHGGAIKDLPFLRDEFPSDGIPGETGFDVHVQGLALIYSSLDSVDLPTSGSYAKAFVEDSAKVLGSTADYQHYGMDLKEFLPADGDRFVSVFQAAYNQTAGSDVPFLEQSMLGGEDTLRGYGRGRFIDQGSLLFNTEERIRLHRWEIFNVVADWELAPFVDCGTVMHSIDRTRESDFEVNPGLGVRAVVRPNIVARIDLGYSHDGSALFMGLGYPF
jgi:outer membrane protein assembly factor BamA